LAALFEYAEAMRGDAGAAGDADAGGRTRAAGGGGGVSGGAGGGHVQQRAAAPVADGDAPAEDERETEEEEGGQRGQEQGGEGGEGQGSGATTKGKGVLGGDTPLEGACAGPIDAVAFEGWLWRVLLYELSSLSHAAGIGTLLCVWMFGFVLSGGLI
jgi:hypothetical protein